MILPPGVINLSEAIVKASDAQVVKSPTDPLSIKEKAALDYFRQQRQSELAPSFSAKLFVLFLNGKSCDEIRRLNPALTLGQIVDARVRGEWDRRKVECVDDLLTSAADRVRQVSLETVSVICDLLAAKNSAYRDKILKFMQSGNEDDIKDLGALGIGGYRQLLDVLQKLTGQANAKHISGTVRCVHEGASLGDESSKPGLLSPEEAESVMAGVIEGKRR